MFKSNIFNNSNLTKVLKFLWPYLWENNFQHKIRFTVAFTLVALYIALNLILPWIFKEIVADFLLVKPNKLLVHGLILLYGLLFTFNHISMSLRQLLINSVVENAVRSLAYKLLEHISSLPINYHENKKIGEVSNIFNRIQNAFSDVFLGLCFFVIPTLIEIVLAIFILSYSYGVVYAVFLTVFLLIFVVFSILKTNQYSYFQRARNNSNKKSDAQIIEGLINFEVIKYFIKKQTYLKNCNDILQQREKVELRASNYFLIVSMFQSCMVGVSLSILLIISGIRVTSGQIAVEDFVFINAYIMQFLLPLSYLGNIFRNVRKGLVDLEHFVEIFYFKRETRYSITNKFLPKEGKIIFDNVHFSYPGQNKILEDISFDIPANSTIGIIGKTGTGKSTITKLLYNFYSPTRGKILIDGFNITNIAPEVLASKIAIIPQNTVIFHDTLLYNISYHRPDATEKEIAHAIKGAHLDKLISTLPQGVNTIVGEQGAKLSGGEKQRISIARAILTNPLIYIFDEPTASLDMFTELAVLKTLKKISHNKTTIIIAHRLHTLTYVDKILVFDDKKLKITGTHQELLKTSKTYQQLWNMSIDK